MVHEVRFGKHVTLNYGEELETVVSLVNSPFKSVHSSDRSGIELLPCRSNLGRNDPLDETEIFLNKELVH